MNTTANFMQLVEAASLLVLGAVAHTLIGDRLRDRPRVRQLVLGLCFGMAALASMADPLVWRPGINLDARGAAIILAGPFGGTLSVVVAVVMSAGMRVAMGGAGVPLGLLAIVLNGVVSIAWGHYLARRGTPIRMRDVHGLALTAAILILPSIVALGATQAAIVDGIPIGLPLIVVNVGGTELLGTLLLWARQRHDALAGLAAREAQLRAISDNLPGAVYQRRMSTSGAIRLTFVSEGLEQVLGVPAAAALADPAVMQQVFAPNDRSRFVGSIAISARDMSPFLFEAQAVLADGREIAIRSSAMPRREDGGDIVWNGLMLDVTAQVRLERQLRDAREAATRTSEAKSRFLAYVTHEFRSPLTAISGYAELAALNPLVTGADPPGGTDPARERARLAEYMATIRSASAHLVDMTEDLLDFGKAEAGRLSLVVETVDAADLVARTAALLRDVAATRDVTIDTSVAPGLLIRADGRRLQQILLNLATNAIKYSHAGGRVAIRAARHATYDLLTVEDWGIGMSAAQLDVALEAYGQVDNAHNRVVAGTGLGLPLVQQLVDLHGGEVEITSTRDKGTCVTVRLPHPDTRHAGTGLSTVAAGSSDDSARTDEAQKSTARPLISQSS